MSKFNKKLPPLLIAGATVFLLGTAYKFVFGKKSKPSALDATGETAAFAQPDPQLTADVSVQPEASPELDSAQQTPLAETSPATKTDLDKAQADKP